MNEDVKKYLSEIGRKGGQASTEAKRAASRENGKKGGRPKVSQDSGNYGSISGQTSRHGIGW